MRDTYNAGLRGGLPGFIEDLLKNKKFHVRIGSCYSDFFDQEMGVPQGSILSVTLFGLEIKSILSKLSHRVSNVLYTWMTFSYATDLNTSTSFNDTFSNV